MLTGLGGEAVIVVLSSKSLTFGVIIVVAEELCLLRPSEKEKRRNEMGVAYIGN